MDASVVIVHLLVLWKGWVVGESVSCTVLLGKVPFGLGTTSVGLSRSEEVVCYLMRGFIQVPPIQLARVLSMVDVIGFLIWH